MEVASALPDEVAAATYVIPARSYSVHVTEDVLALDLDLDSQALSRSLESFAKIIERATVCIPCDQHDHRKELAAYRLTDVFDVSAALCEHGRYCGNDPWTILA